MKIFVIFLIVAFFKFEAESVKLDCEFKVDYFYGYQCYVKNLEILSPGDRTITKISGAHLKGKSNKDVKYFDCEFINVEYFPLEITKFFSKLGISTNL